MKQWISFILLATISIGLMNACGPSEEELERQRQARQDSLREVQQRQDSIEQARQDSIARVQARRDSIAAAKERRIEYDPDGNIAVQVEAWRGVCTAEDRISLWNERGYENSYVVRHGKKETGNVWFRIRLGRFSDPGEANQLSERVQDNYGSDIWITQVVPGDEQVDTSKCTND